MLNYLFFFIRQFVVADPPQANFTPLVTLISLAKMFFPPPPDPPMPPPPPLSPLKPFSLYCLVEQLLSSSFSLICFCEMAHFYIHLYCQCTI